MTDIPDRLHVIPDFRLTSGEILPEAAIAYVTLGKLNADGRNAVLMTHGFTSTHRYMLSAPDAGSGPGEGSWGQLVGPGRAIDTDRFFVISSNMLGSSYGSTCPRSLNPKTGRPYGPDFPAFGLPDIVNAQKRLADALGVKRLAAVIGPSYGGFQAFQWAVSFPDFMDAIVPAVTGLKGPSGPGADQELIARFSKEANWNGGHYYKKGGIDAAMQALRVETLLKYGMDDELAETMPDPAARKVEIERRAAKWAREFDANSLIALARASAGHDLTDQVGRIRARTLYVLSRTDKLFPPSLAPGVMAALKAVGVSAEYFEIDSEYGHQASGSDALKWAPTLRRFLDALPRA